MQLIWWPNRQFIWFQWQLCAALLFVFIPRWHLEIVVICITEAIILFKVQILSTPNKSVILKEVQWSTINVLLPVHTEAISVHVIVNTWFMFWLISPNVLKTWKMKWGEGRSHQFVFLVFSLSVSKEFASNLSIYWSKVLFPLAKLLGCEKKMSVSGLRARCLK